MGGNCILFSGKVACRFAYQAWTPTHVEVISGPSTCYGPARAGHLGAWLLQVPAGTNYDPVVNETLTLAGHVCAGDALIFTEYGSLQRFRLALDVSAVKLNDFRASDFVPLTSGAVRQ